VLGPYEALPYYIHTYIHTSALVGGEWLDSCPGRFTSGEKAPGTHCLGGPLNRSGRHGEKKVLDPTGTRTPTPRLSSP
jgi:hypothetical protein